MRAATEGLSAARTAGFAAILGLVQDALSQIYFEVGRPDLGEAAAEEAAQVLMSIGAPMWSALGRAERGRVALAQGDYERAWALLGSLSVDTDERRNDLQAIIFSCDAIAQAGVAAGHNAEVRSFLNWLIPRLEQYGVLRCVADLSYWYGRLERVEGHLSAAEGRLLYARELYDRAASRARIWRADLALADVYAALGDSDRSVACRERAYQVVSQIASEIQDEDVRRDFLSNPDVAGALAG